MKIIIYSILILLFPLISIADDDMKNITVCDTCEFNSIKQAIEACDKGGIITILPGEYRESRIHIRKSLTLKGIDYPKIISPNGDPIFEIGANFVSIIGLELSGVETSHVEDRAAIRTYKSKNIVISNNIIRNCFFGIYIAHSKNTIIKDNKIYGNAKREANSGNAIHAWYSKKLLISGNETYNHRDGIYLEFVDNSKIIKNISKNHLRYGLHFMFSDHDEYIENHFENNGAGVAVMYSEHIRMIKNVFYKNWGSNSYGLLLKEIKNGEIKFNLFSKNTVGIFAESAMRLDIQHNEFGYNGWALKILSSCEDLKFTYNNFSANTFELAINHSRKNSNLYENNYWSNYAGYDLDKDGIGDIAHRPVVMFSRVVSQSPASIILLRSFFVDIMNYAEKVVPAFSPDDLKDAKPLMKEIDNDRIYKPK